MQRGEAVESWYYYYYYFFLMICSLCFNTHRCPVSSVICVGEWGECDVGTTLFSTSFYLSFGNPELFCICSEQLVCSNVWLSRR